MMRFGLEERYMSLQRLIEINMDIGTDMYTYTFKESAKCTCAPKEPATFNSSVSYKSVKRFGLPTGQTRLTNEGSTYTKNNF